MSQGVSSISSRIPAAPRSALRSTHAPELCGLRGGDHPKTSILQGVSSISTRTPAARRSALRSRACGIGYEECVDDERPQVQI